LQGDDVPARAEKQVSASVAAESGSQDSTGDRTKQQWLF
jgi:hypothetical protein